MVKNIKKNLSVDLAKTIEKPLRDYYGLFRVDDSNEKYLLYLTDNEIKPILFFGILKETHDNRGHRIEYVCKPYNTKTSNSKSSSAKIEQFEQIIKRWLDNLKYYEEDSVLNDPLIRGYQREFYNDFKIVDDENAEFSGFTYDQQIQLSEFFNIIESELDKLKVDTNKVLIEELKQDAVNLKDAIGKETKNSFMRKFSLFLAKARKGSIKVCNFILIEFAKYFVKGQAKFVFNYARENIPAYLKQLIETVQ